MSAEIQNPKSKIQNRKRAFVFLAALGVMAVGLLVAFAMSFSVQFTSYRAGSSREVLQERLMAQSATDLIAQNKIAADGKPHPFTISGDHLRGRTIAVEVTASQLSAGHAIYKLAGLAHRPGDVLIDVRSPELEESRHVTGKRSLIANTEGRRLRSVDVTQAKRLVMGE